MWYDNLNGGLKVVNQAGGVLGTVTTVSTVTNVSQLGGASIPDVLTGPLSKIRWCESVRRCIS